MFAQFTLTCGNQMHHAVELLLKACLAKQDSWQEILKYGHRGSYGHDLEKLWAEFKRRNPDPKFAVHDELIQGLNKFEDIRYPEDLIKGGATFGVGLYELDPQHRSGPADSVSAAVIPEGRRFYLELPGVDRLVQALAKATDFNPEAMVFMRAPHAAKYHWLDNAAPFLPQSWRP